MPDTDGVTTREHLEHQIQSLREHIDHKFDALDARLEQLQDHETRIRAIERAQPIRNVAEAVIGIVALIGAALGIDRQ